MAGFNQTRLPLLTIAISIVLMLATSTVNSASPSFCRECAPFLPGAVAYWPMTMETKGFDISGYENHAKFVGLTFTDGPTGEVNEAVRFNGSSKSYAKATNSPSMNVGKYTGFTFSGYIRYLGFQNKTASLIDWSGIKGYGVFIVAASEQIIQLHLFPNQFANQHKAAFPEHKLIKGKWHFIGMSYDKSSGRATIFNDGQLEVKQLDKNIAAGSDKTSEVGLGIDLSAATEFNYEGDMSCMMLFKFSLTVDDLKKVWEFCRKTKSTKTIPPTITVSDINTTNATASWTKSPGIFSGYSVTLERKDVELSREIVYPKSILSSATILKSDLVELVPGATYRVHVWHMQGELTGRARSSPWFKTTPYLAVESDSIIFSELTPTSARVSWKDVTGNYDGFSVHISPTTGGAKADPSTVPRGMTTTSLMNLSPMTYYTITIRAKIGLENNYPSTKSFHTPDANTPSVGVNIGWLVAGICLGSIVVIVGIVLKVYWKKICPRPCSRKNARRDFQTGSTMPVRSANQDSYIPMGVQSSQQSSDKYGETSRRLDKYNDISQRLGKNNANIWVSTEDDRDQARALMDEDRFNHKKVTIEERHRNEISNVKHGEDAIKKHHVNGNRRWEQLTKQCDVSFPKNYPCKQLFRLKQCVANRRLASLARFCDSSSWADTIYLHNEVSNPLSVTIIDGVDPAIDMAVLSTGELLVARREKPYIRAFSIDTCECRDINIENNEKTKDGMWRVETDESDNMFLINSHNDPFLLVVSPNGELIDHVQLEGRVLHMAFSQEKRILYVAAGDKILRFHWLKDHLRVLTPLRLEGFLFRDICIGSSNEVLVVGEMAKNISIYQVVESKTESGLSLRKITHQDDMERQKLVPHICIMDDKLWLGNFDKMEIFKMS